MTSVICCEESVHFDGLSSSVGTLRNKRHRGAGGIQPEIIIGGTILSDSTNTSILVQALRTILFGWNSRLAAESQSGRLGNKVSGRRIIDVSMTLDTRVSHRRQGYDGCEQPSRRDKWGGELHCNIDVVELLSFVFERLLQIVGSRTSFENRQMGFVESGVEPMTATTS